MASAASSSNLISRFASILMEMEMMRRAGAASVDRRAKTTPRQDGRKAGGGVERGESKNVRFSLEFLETIVDGGGGGKLGKRINENREKTGKNIEGR